MLWLQRVGNTANTIDVKQAFLQSDELTREVFVLPPQEAGLGDQTVWKLRVAVYGLADASRQWYKTVKRMLTDCGLHEVMGEPSLFYYTNDQAEMCGVLAAHVDDFLFGGNHEFHEKKEMFKSAVRVGATQREEVSFCGLLINNRSNGIQVTAKESEDLNRAILNGVDLEAELTVQEERWVRSVIGSLQWVASTHRPDLAYHLAIALGNLNSHRQKFAIREANGLIDRYHANRGLKLVIQPLGINWELEVFGDSAFKQSNQQGVVVCLRRGGGTEMNVVSWKSKKAERKSWSTLAAETHVLQVAMDKAIHVQHVLRQMRLEPRKTTVVTDNLSLRRCLYSGRPTKEERLRKEFAVARDMMTVYDVRVRFVPGHVMLADCLTKVLSKENHLIITMREGHFPELSEYDAEEVTDEMMKRAEELIEMQSYPEFRQPLAVAHSPEEDEKMYVDELLHGARASSSIWPYRHNQSIE